MACDSDTFTCEEIASHSTSQFKYLDTAETTSNDNMANEIYTYIYKKYI